MFTFVRGPLARHDKALDVPIRGEAGRNHAAGRI